MYASVTALHLKFCKYTFGKASEAVQKTTLDARMVRSKLGRQAAALRKGALELKGKNQGDAWRKASEVEERAYKQVIAKAQVVASTCISAGTVGSLCIKEALLISSSLARTQFIHFEHLDMCKHICHFTD